MSEQLSTMSSLEDLLDDPEKMVQRTKLGLGLETRLGVYTRLKECSSTTDKGLEARVRIRIVVCG